MELQSLSASQVPTALRSRVVQASGVEESKVWICRECRDALCVRDGINMPGPALANLMWG